MTSPRLPHYEPAKIVLVYDERLDSLQIQSQTDSKLMIYIFLAALKIVCITMIQYYKTNIKGRVEVVRQLQNGITSLLSLEEISKVSDEAKMIGKKRND